MYTPHTLHIACLYIYIYPSMYVNMYRLICLFIYFTFCWFSINTADGCQRENKCVKAYDEIIFFINNRYYHVLDIKEDILQRTCIVTIDQNNKCEVMEGTYDNIINYKSLINFNNFDIDELSCCIRLL